MNTRTPPPWDVQNKGVLGERSARHEIVAGVTDPDRVRNLPTILKMPDLSDQSYANAAFIVRACNAYEDMRDVLRTIRHAVDTGRITGIAGTALDFELDHALALVKEAKNHV